MIIILITESISHLYIVSLVVLHRFYSLHIYCFNINMNLLIFLFSDQEYEVSDFYEKKI